MEGAGVALSGNASDNSILKITLTFTMAVPRPGSTRSNACRRRHAVSIDDELIPRQVQHFRGVSKAPKTPPLLYNSFFCLAQLVVMCLPYIYILYREEGVCREGECAQL